MGGRTNTWSIATCKMNLNYNLEVFLYFGDAILFLPDLKLLDFPKESSDNFALYLQGLM